MNVKRPGLGIKSAGNLGVKSAGKGFGGEGAGGGDVSGPALSTDNAIARYDGAGGKTIQNSDVTIDDSNNVTTAAQFRSSQSGSATPCFADALGTTGVRVDTGSVSLITSSTRRWIIGSSGLLPFTSGGSDADIGTSANKVRNVIQAGYHELSEMTAPSAPTDGVRIFAQDNGAGKTQLMALFPTGAAQQILIEA